MKKIIFLMCMVSMIVGCGINTNSNPSKSTTYTLDSVNPR